MVKFLEVKVTNGMLRTSKVQIQSILMLSREEMNSENQFVMFLTGNIPNQPILEVQALTRIVELLGSLLCNGDLTIGVEVEKIKKGKCEKFKVFL